MKKLFYIIALSVLLLVACGETKEYPTMTEVAAEKEAKEKAEVYSIDEAVKSVTKKPYEVKQNEGIVSITIEDDTLHEGSKRKILKDSAKLFAELSKVEGITAPMIYWTSTLTDQYGNERIGEILAISIDEETFAKINWDNYKELDIEALANGYSQHATLKDK